MKAISHENERDKQNFAKKCLNPHNRTSVGCLWLVDLFYANAQVLIILSYGMTVVFQAGFGFNIVHHDVTARRPASFAQ
jgi:hypothetical protein